MDAIEKGSEAREARTRRRQLLYDLYLTYAEENGWTPLHPQQAADAERSAFANTNAHLDGNSVAQFVVDTLLRQREELLSALRPFARIHQTGWKGSMLENKPGENSVLYHHASGTSVTLGDFAVAHAVIERVEGNR